MYMVISGLRTHPEGTLALFEWMKEHWDGLFKRFPPGSTMLGHVVQICCSNMTHAADVAAVEKFFADKNKTGYEQAYAQSLDAIRAKSAWLDRDGNDVKEWVKAYA